MMMRTPRLGSYILVAATLIGLGSDEISAELTPEMLVDLIEDGRPHEPPCWIIGCARLAADTHHRPNGLPERPSIPTEENNGRRAMSRDVGPTGVNHMGQVNGWQKLLDQLLAELPLHEAVGRDLAGEPTRHRQTEDPLHERHSQRVLHMA